MPAKEKEDLKASPLPCIRKEYCCQVAPQQCPFPLRLYEG